MPIFINYPKKRPELPGPYKNIYTKHYLKNRLGEYKTTSLSNKLERWLHRKVAQDLINGNGNHTTLEIGAGNLNQLQYEETGLRYDVIEPFNDLLSTSPYLNKIDNIYTDIDKVPTKNKYSRITAIASFEHICNLPHVVAKSTLLLAKGGNLRVSIPNEGTIMSLLGTKVTGYEFKKTYGLDYQVLMNHEHVNTADEIEDILKYFYNNVTSKVFGINKKLAFYRFYECSNPKINNAIEYLNE